ncbi:MAG TPA: type I glyceraldehyde-3-phosphate dehydrogenase [Bacilli bacterium]|nr:type I glyceraldehyde-3-phosphate dehydrogenase [Bacilli bacterium]
MAVKVAINGFGRIGRLAFRLMYGDPDFKIVAVNDLTDAKQLAYLLKYDSTQGRYKADKIKHEGDEIIIGKDRIKVFAKMDPAELPWKELDVDVVMECTGVFTKEEGAMKHINAGAKKVIISAPGKGPNVKTIVYNVNHDILDGSEKVISAASCTTNCLAPMAKILEDKFGIVKGFMTTIHAYTGDQVTLDVAHKKGIASRRGRAAALNIVPTTTGAASAVGKVIPALLGKLDGIAMRVPTGTGSAVDLVVELKKKVTVEEVNKAMKKAADESFGYTEDPIVSSDIIGDHHGGVLDAASTCLLEVDGKQLVKLIAWYDNEMGYTAQMVRLAKHIAHQK